MRELLDLVGAMRSLTGMRMQEANARYSHDDIAWQHRYVDIVTVTADGRLFIDYARFHDVTPDGVSANVSHGGDGRADASPEDLAQPR